jgi:hypothetical protein
VQLLAFSIADELFMRSKLFRSLLADSLDGFLPLAVGFRRANPLPPPTMSAALLRKAAVQALERWHHLFGAHYRQLRLAVEYLKESARVQFSGLRATVDARAARETRMQEIYAGKVEQLRENLASIKAEMDSSWDPATESMGMSSGAGDDGGATMDGSWDCAAKSRARGRDIIMPNLKSSVTTTASAVEYTDEVLKALPPGSTFFPLMTLPHRQHKSR